MQLSKSHSTRSALQPPSCMAGDVDEKSYSKASLCMKVKIEKSKVACMAADLMHEAVRRGDK